MKYLSTFETAQKWNISARRIAFLCAEERIDGVQKAGNNWIIPESAEKPKDMRVKTGKYARQTNDKRGIENEID